MLYLKFYGQFIKFNDESYQKKILLNMSFLRKKKKKKGRCKPSKHRHRCCGGHASLETGTVHQSESLPGAAGL